MLAKCDEKIFEKFSQKPLTNAFPCGIIITVKQGGIER
jgi:hypothetical protein